MQRTWTKTGSEVFKRDIDDSPHKAERSAATKRNGNMRVRVQAFVW
jgi:hypothetical protein